MTLGQLISRTFTGVGAVINTAVSVAETAEKAVLIADPILDAGHARAENFKDTDRAALELRKLESVKELTDRGSEIGVSQETMNRILAKINAEG
jgi:hypothetical protein